MKIHKLLYVIIISSCSLFILFLGASMKMVAQETLEIQRSIEKTGTKIIVEYNIRNIPDETNVNNVKFETKGFGILQEKGKPEVPSRIDFIALPLNLKYNFSLDGFDEISIKDQDCDISSGPKLSNRNTTLRNEIIGQYDERKFFPQAPATALKIIYFQGHPVLQVRINPVAYRTDDREMIVYTRIRYSVSFDDEAIFVDPSKINNSFPSLMNNFVLNNEEFKNIHINSEFNPQDTVKDYIILTTPQFESAARELACIKRQLGYSVLIDARQSWDTITVKEAIHSRYHNWEPKPQFFVILGDQQFIPGEFYSYMLVDDFATDLAYACMDGPDDYFPDISRGRISVAHITEAQNAVDKIRAYEFNPPTDTNYYHSSFHASYFQDDDHDSYDDRRFALTTEELYAYMIESNGFEIERIYNTESINDPQFWNDGMFSAGEPLPQELRKPGFPWDGDHFDIQSRINDGVLYGFYDGHGFSDGWMAPQFRSNHVTSLTNQNKYPVIFSLCCSSGEFWKYSCFCEVLLRQENKGAAAAFGFSSPAFIGHTDALGMGMLDAIWNEPGFIPEFTGSYGIQNPTCQPHESIVQMGDILIQSLQRMTELWGDPWGHDKYMHQILHLFGDPAMKIWTDVPTPVTADHDTVILPGQQSVNIYSSNIDEGIATLVCEDELYGRAAMENGIAVITFDSLPSEKAVLTISCKNFIPYVDTIYKSGVSIEENLIYKDDPCTLRLNPNPATNAVHIESSCPGILDIFRLDGSKTVSVIVNKQLDLDLAGYSKGIYLLVLRSEQEMISRKLVVGP